MSLLLRPCVRATVVSRRSSSSSSLTPSMIASV
jgi:hypothetical protein